LASGSPARGANACSLLLTIVHNRRKNHCAIKAFARWSSVAVRSRS
jgi:hypothetical protein